MKHGDIFKGFGLSKLAVHTRNIGNAKLFKLNMKNSYVKSLAELFDKLINEEFRKASVEKELKH